MLEYPNENKNRNKKYKNQNVSHVCNNIIDEIYDKYHLKLVSSIIKDSIIQLELRSTKKVACCPYCGKNSNHVHSKYTRTIKDLSILGEEVIIKIHTRKFFCNNEECDKKTFAEQPSDLVSRYGRRTSRCNSMIDNVGLKVSSINASKILSQFGIEVSPSTVIRNIYRIPLKPYSVKELGVDDWAYLKGVRYGTILVDMESHKVLDLLSDRESGTFKKWLDDHPEVEIVSRDRSTSYSKAIADTGRNIMEIADRFHLLKNIFDCLTKVINKKYLDIRNAYRPPLSFIEEKKNNGIKSESIIIKKSEIKDLRANTFKEIKELQRKGFNMSAIAYKLHIARQTVRKYYNVDEMPPRIYKNGYYAIDDIVEQSFLQGESITCIYRKVVEEERFGGSLTPFCSHYSYLRVYKNRVKKVKKKITKNEKRIIDNRPPFIMAKTISSILCKKICKCTLKSEDDQLLDKLVNKIGWFRHIYELIDDFYGVIMKARGTLDTWINKYKQTTIPELKTFITGVIIDKNAIVNAANQTLSNGTVEGFVNKLKVTKRIMYGRAGLELLERKMVLSDA